MSQIRRLAAILAADVAGYSRLMWAERKAPAKGRSKPKSSMLKMGGCSANRIAASHGYLTWRGGHC